MHIERMDRASERTLSRARSVATLLDSSIPIPGTGRKIGLDPILGLIPLVGDFAGALLSGYIVLAAAQAGAPTLTLIRMVANVAFDTLVGSVPAIGDLFDAAWKSNTKNVALFESHLAANAGQERSPQKAFRLGGILLVVSALAALALFTFVLGLVYLVAVHSLFGR